MADSSMTNIGAVEQYGKNLANVNQQMVQIFKQIRQPQWAITHSSVCFDAQLVPNLAGGEPLQAGPVLCWRVPIGFGALSYFLAWNVP